MEATEAPEARQNFGVIDQSSIDPAFFGLSAYPTTSTAPPARVSRREAMQVAAVKRSRDLIAGTIGSLPVYVLNRDNERGSRTLFDQPELGVPRSVTFARTVEDMLFEGVAWWRITAFGWDNKPARVVRLDASTVQVRERQRVFVRSDGTQQGSSWEYVPDEELICFPSPNDPLLVAGARAIRTCIALDAAASRYADEPQPMGWFTPSDGFELSLEAAQDALESWKAARQQRATGYLEGLDYHQAVAWSPEQMQLVQARQHAITEIARLCGLDTEELGVSTTSRTYFNAVDRRMTFQDMTLGPYVTAIADRLSMDDVTPAGYRVRFDFGAFTRSSEAERMDTYAKAIAVGAYGVDEVVRREELPEPPPKPEPAPVEPAPVQEQPVNNSAVPSQTFSGTESMTFSFAETTDFKASQEKRTVTGTILPFGAVGRNDQGQWRFAPGSVEWPKSAVSQIKLNNEHDRRALLGAATVIRSNDQGLSAEFKVRRGPEGDSALMAAEDAVLDGFSVEVDILDAVPDPQNKGAVLVTRARLKGVALTGNPAFTDARLTSVAASSNPERNPVMTDATEPQAPAAPAAAAVDFTGLADTIKGAISEGFSALPAREVVPAAAGVRLFVDEELPYRFGGGRGSHDFSSDVIAHLRDRDGEAGQRVLGFMEQAFANVATTDINELNPDRQRPDMYVDQQQYQYPVWEAINKGPLSDITPFVLPKFNSSSGLVAAHVEGTEPTEGALTTTGQTITPAAMSGKAIINREVWDQGGNPQFSTILWRQMVRAWNEALEAKAVAVLTAGAGSITDIALTAGAADDDLEGELTAALASLQYVRGGYTMRDFFVQIDLYKKLVAAVDGNGRKLFPIVNPQNATGTTDGFFGSVMVGGLRARPSWALAATGSVVANSWLFDREFVHGFASAPTRLDFSTAVATVEVGIWGYVATAITDFSKVRQVTYDPVA